MDYAVTGYYDTLFSVKDGLVQRVQHRSDQLRYGVGSGRGIAVECQDKFRAVKAFSAACGYTKLGVFTQQQLRQCKDRAALAFTAAEFSAPCVLCPRTGEKIEAAAVF